MRSDKVDKLLMTEDDAGLSAGAALIHVEIAGQYRVSAWSENFLDVYYLPHIQDVVTK